MGGLAPQHAAVPRRTFTVPLMWTYSILNPDASSYGGRPSAMPRRLLVVDVGTSAKAGALEKFGSQRSESYSRLKKVVIKAYRTTYAGCPASLGFWVGGQSCSNVLASTALSTTMIRICSK